MIKPIKIIEVKSEIGAGTRGASLGIDALKIAALDFMSNFFVNFPSDKVETENGMVKVKTGLSNWSFIEIVSGLDEKTVILKPE